MRDEPTFEAQTLLSDLLDRVERGEEIVIARAGRPVARLVPAGLSAEAKERARAAAYRIRARVKDMGQNWSPEEIKALINEGRR